MVNPPHQCPDCQSTYSRTEHLKRHMLTHRGEKRYECSNCRRRYSRRDVWKRHYQACATHPGNVSGDSVQPKGRPTRRNRACKRCNAQKTRCGETRPCLSCIEARVECLDFSQDNRRSTQLAESGTVGYDDKSRHGEERQEEWASQRRDVLSSVTCSNNGQSTDLASPESLGHLNANTWRGNPVAHGTSTYQALGASCLVAAEQSSASGNMAQPQAWQMSQPTAYDRIPSWYDDFSMLADSSAHAFELGFGFEGMDLTWLSSCFSPYATFDAPIELRQSVEQVNDMSEVVTETCDERGNGVENTRTSALGMPEGMNLLQFDPFEGHRTVILQQLQQSQHYTGDLASWLSCDNLKLFLKSYFRYLHRHTPFIHCPTWNISTTRTHLILSMSLIGAFYAGDLKEHGPQVRKMRAFAEHYTWNFDGAETSDQSLELDTLQSLYLLAMVDAFYVPSKRYRSTFDFAKVVSWARRSGYFKETQDETNQQEPGWEKWAELECRRRTAYMIYLFDAARTIFFFEPPQMSAFEMRRPLPTHEAVYAAPTRAIWEERYTRAKNLSQLQYPVMFYHFLSGKHVRSQVSFSVMGGFILIHGILVHIWESAQNDPKTSQRRGHSEDVAVLEENSKHRREVLGAALNFWLECWNKSIAFPLSDSASGLYRDNSMIYWYLGCLLAQHDSPFMQHDSGSTGGYRFIGIPRLMKHLILFKEKGYLDHVDSSDQVLITLSDPQWTTHLEDRESRQNLGIMRVSNGARKEDDNTDDSLPIHADETRGLGAEEENMDRLAVDFMLSGAP